MSRMDPDARWMVKKYQETKDKKLCLPSIKVNLLAFLLSLILAEKRNVNDMAMI